MNCHHEVEEDQEEIEDDNDPPLSTQGDTPPNRAQLETPVCQENPSPSWALGLCQSQGTTGHCNT